MSRIPRPPSFLTVCLGLVASAALVSGCALFSNPPAPTPSGPEPTAPATPPAPSPSPTPTPVPAGPSPTRPVASIVLISAIGESEAGTPSTLAWMGVQDAAAILGVSPKLVTPASMAEVTAAVKAAAENGTTLVVTVGPQAAPATLEIAGVYPTTQFFELDQAIGDGVPANVHGFVFDEAEAGYLAGFVAASVTRSARIGIVGDTATDVATANYAGGFRNGAVDANPGVDVSVAYATRADDPQKGRAAIDGLVTGKVDVIAAMSDLSGVGAMREACARGVAIVALAIDASALVPDVTPCLVASVLQRYDVAVRDAILRYAANDPMQVTTILDVASGGIALSDLHKSVPPGFGDRLAGLLAAMRNGPPRPTPAPTIDASPAA